MDLDAVQQAAREQFARQSHRYGRGHILEQIEDVRQAAENIPLPHEAAVLDVATGGGHTGMFFAGRGCEVTLADIAQPMLDAARSAADERGLSVRTQLHPAESFPNADNTFDLVTCRVAAHHFSAPEKFVAETARVLKPGGYFLLIDPTVEDNEPEAEDWAHAVEKLRDPSHNRLLTPGTWRRLCETNGLSIRHLELRPFKQPDLQWYFDAAATSDDSRTKVLELIATAPQPVRQYFRIGEEDGKIVWWWRRMILVSRKASPSP